MNFRNGMLATNPRAETKRSAKVAELVADGWRVTSVDGTTGTVYLRYDRYEGLALRTDYVSVNMNGDVTY